MKATIVIVGAYPFDCPATAAETKGVVVLATFIRGDSTTVKDYAADAPVHVSVGQDWETRRYASLGRAVGSSSEGCRG